MTAVCRRCGGTCVDWDDEGLRCLLCARPYVQPVLPLQLARDDADVSSLIDREAKSIREALAAGKRLWS